MQVDADPSAATKPSLDSDEAVTGPSAESRSATPPRRGWKGELLSRFALVGVLVLLWVGFSLKNPQVFGTTSNLQSILSTQATTGMLALAIVVPLVAGHFDLSTGFQLGLSQSLCAVLVIQRQWSPVAAIVVVLASGVVIGVINGQLITRLRLPSFTTTLGTGMVVLGLTEWLTQNQVVTGPAPTWFFNLARQQVAGVPLPFVYLVVAAIVLFVLLELTVWGRRSYAVGANPTAARLSGIPVDRQIRQSFVITGFLCSVAGCISMMRLGGSSPVIGLGSLLPAFAAAFLGATSIRPGRYNVAGTMIAVYVVGVGITGLQQLGAQSFGQDLFNGAALLVALVISTMARRRKTAV